MFGKIRTQAKGKDADRPTRHHEQSPSHKLKAPITHKIHKQHNPHPPKQKQQHPTNRSLKGSEFRLLNEILYTQDSKKAVEYFQENPEYCNTYHEGFREQTTSWDVNPLDMIIQTLLSYGKRLETKKVIDLGCGEGRLQESIEHTGCKIRSYDIMQLKPFIIKADISKLKLKSETQDIAVFCLSLMGVNYIQFILEAIRVLKVGGELFIAEVESRCKDWRLFEQMLKVVGCKLKELKREKYFRLMILEKAENSVLREESKYPGSSQTLLQYSQSILNPCIYKRR